MIDQLKMKKQKTSGRRLWWRLMVIGGLSITAIPAQKLEKEIGERLSWDSLYVNLEPHIRRNSSTLVPASIGNSGSLFGFCSRALNLCVVYKRRFYRNPEKVLSTECCGSADERETLSAMLNNPLGAISVEPSSPIATSSSRVGSGELLGQPTSLGPALRPIPEGQSAGSGPAAPYLVKSEIEFRQVIPSAAEYRRLASKVDVASLRDWAKESLATGIYQSATIPCVKSSDPSAFVRFSIPDGDAKASLIVNVYRDRQSGAWETAWLLRSPPRTDLTERLELLFKEGGCGVVYPALPAVRK